MTSTEIAAAKEKYGKVLMLSIGEHTVYLKQPSRTVISASVTKATVDPLMQAEVIVENCYLGGSLSKEAIIDNPGILLGINNVMKDILDVQIVTLKNC